MTRKLYYSFRNCQNRQTFIYFNRRRIDSCLFAAVESYIKLSSLCNYSPIRYICAMPRSLGICAFGGWFKATFIGMEKKFKFKHRMYQIYIKKKLYIEENFMLFKFIVLYLYPWVFKSPKLRIQIT